MARSILVVDDESGIRQSLTSILEEEGYRVEAVGSGEECLATVAARPFDLILLDVWLPGMDGLVTLERLQQFALAARTNGRVLIYGESGTGKELVARALHAASLRRDRPLVEVNCAAIPEELIESELFGHVKGSFTGASEDKVGKFQKADMGTLFLDEVGEERAHIGLDRKS